MCIRDSVWLARLNDDLLEMLDQKKIGIVPGIALSFLKKEEQEWVTDILLEEKIKLQTKEAEVCKDQSQKGLLTQNGVREILCYKKVKKMCIRDSDRIGLIIHFFQKNAGGISAG